MVNTGFSSLLSIVLKGLRCCSYAVVSVHN